jgi:hypothetical protein
MRDTLSAMNEQQLDAMIMDIAEALDYDIWKSLVPELSEEPEEIEYEMERLRKAARKHVG